MKMSKLDLLAGVLVTVIWGANFSVIGLGLQSLDPFLLTLLRFTFCAIPLVFFIRRPRGVSYCTLATYGVLFGAGLWGVVNIAMYNGLSAGMSSVFLQFSAFFTIVLSGLFLNESINRVHMAGMAFAVAGLLLILYLSNKTSTTLGIVLVLLAAVAWSVCNLIVKVKKPADMIAFIVWSSLFSLPVLLLMTLWFEGLRPFENLLEDFTWGAGFSIFFQCYITTIGGYLVWNNLMKKYPASMVAPLSLIVPVSGILASWLFFDERLSLGQFLAIGLVFVGIAIFVNSAKIAVGLARR
ncbi:O-acetylserine/cysteine efflux transporter [Pseudomonas sp. BIGb0450]|uniref:EamA family transporter n=1 Tax=Pseudomonas yamanorum TaxID=515393 RepID=A0A7Y8K9Q3_9PSED|nr:MULTISPECIES: EamA family transporter [Pseudomonas]MCS3420727.1 O-acetylserine/cysteine efflux transporter [Pseudomonas sp. BIGb0558]MCS3440606.1 O-acetylserine/cysteine efflux transporter [Pseudomonas sp. BIGb0450]NWE79900.1 EamA family transporter [Pseudomonas yamanorum]